VVAVVELLEVRLADPGAGLVVEPVAVPVVELAGGVAIGPIVVPVVVPGAGGVTGTVVDVGLVLLEPVVVVVCANAELASSPAAAAVISWCMFRSLVGKPSGRARSKHLIVGGGFGKRPFPTAG
jgi:hypothetical protein